MMGRTTSCFLPYWLIFVSSLSVRNSLIMRSSSSSEVTIPCRDTIGRVFVSYFRWRSFFRIVLCRGDSFFSFHRLLLSGNCCRFSLSGFLFYLVKDIVLLFVPVLCAFFHVRFEVAEHSLLYHSEESVEEYDEGEDAPPVDDAVLYSATAK